MLNKFNSGHARKMKIVKNTVSVCSRDPSGFLNPDEEQFYRHSSRVVNPRELLRNDCSGTIVTIRNVLLTIISIVIPTSIVGLISASDNCCSVVFLRFFCVREKKWSRVFTIQILKFHRSVKTHLTQFDQFIKLDRYSSETANPPTKLFQ